MGLDGVELVVAIEDAFQIDLEDSEVEKVETVGDFYDLVVSQLKSGPLSTRCLTSAAFYRTRLALMEGLGLARREVRPSTVLQAILPERGRRAAWERIRRESPLRISDLEHSRISTWVFLAMSMGVTVGPGLYWNVRWGWLAGLILGGILVWVLLLRVTPWLETELPPDQVTVGDLARMVLALNRGRFAEEKAGCNENEVWETLRRLVALQTGARLERITKEARIVNDLGMD